MSFEDKDFAVFILVHKRPERVITYKALRDQGYTGPIYLIADNEDPTVDGYRARYGNQVIVFDKAASAAETDTCDNFDRLGRTSDVFARNACFKIARDLGYTYFLELDDDYRPFQFRFNDKLEYDYARVLNLDAVFHAILEYYRSIPALTIAMAQGGDMLGGGKSTSMSVLSLKRKAMNTFSAALTARSSLSGA